MNADEAKAKALAKSMREAVFDAIAAEVDLAVTKERIRVLELENLLRRCEMVFADQSRNLPNELLKDIRNVLKDADIRNILEKGKKR